MYELGTDSARFNHFFPIFLCGIHPAYNCQHMQDSLPRLQCCVWIRTTGPSVACSCWSRRSSWSRSMFLSESFRHHVEFSGVKASKLKSKQHMFKVYEHDSIVCKYLRSNCSNVKRRHPIWSAPLIGVICVENFYCTWCQSATSDKSVIVPEFETDLQKWVVAVCANQRQTADMFQPWFGRESNCLNLSERCMFGSGCGNYKILWIYVK